jgi:hypothetical protein
MNHFRMNRIYAFLILIPLSVLLGSYTPDTKIDQEPKMPWSFKQLNNIILSEFPEAYEDFINITFERIDEYINPVSATFLIRDSYFENKLNDDILKARAANVLKKMGDPPSCWVIHVSEPEEYGWSEWDEKTVRKVTLEFLIGC